MQNNDKIQGFFSEQLRELKATYSNKIWGKVYTATDKEKALERCLELADFPVTLEDIKTDLSSIYLTSYQKLPFSIANENFVSYTTPPISPSSFTHPQIILNSDRIVLNAKSDSILISGQKSVGLSSNNSINIEAKEIFLDGRDIRLGSKNASQPALKGEDTVELLKSLVTEISNLSTALKTIQMWPGGNPIPDPTIQPVASVAEANLNRIKAQLDSLKSNFVKII